METIRAHERLPQRAVCTRAVEMLEKVGIASAAAAHRRIIRISSPAGSASG